MKTAVEWLKEIYDSCNTYEKFISNSDWEQANKMFEEQNKDAWKDGKYCDTIYNEVNYEDAEQYYNETFKSE
jgi:hypothetical protein